MRPPRQRERCLSRLRAMLRKLPPGSPAPSEDELAQCAQVARRTARSALQCAANEGLVQHRRHHARLVTALAHVAPGTGAVVAVLGGQLDAPEGVQHGLAKAVQTTLDAAGWRVVRMHALPARSVAAALHGCTAAVVLEGGPLLEAVSSGLPVVAVGEDEAPTGCAAVIHDHAEGGRRLVHALAAAGRRRLLRLLTVRERPGWLRERERGITEGLATTGLDLLSTVPVPIRDRAGANDAALDALARIAAGHLVEWLRTPGRIDAIIGTSDSEMFVYARALRLWGMQPGRDIALAAYDGYWRRSPEQAIEPLSGCIVSIDQDFPALARAVVSLLREAGTDSWIPRRVLVAPALAE